MKRLAPLLLAVAAVLLAPTGASGATTLPNPESLRATLPDPIDSSWIEVLPGASGYIDGPVNYDVLRAYYDYYQQTDAFIQGSLDILRNAGFVGGYERQWTHRQANDELTERVYVFATGSGAATVANSYNSVADSVFDSTLGSDAHGTVDKLGNGAAFTGVDFARGNAYYAVSIGSYTSVKPAQVIPQARLLYDRAPSSIALSHTSNQTILTKNLWLLAAAGLMLLLGVATLVAVGTVALLLPHRNFVQREGAPLRT